MIKLITMLCIVFFVSSCEKEVVEDKNVERGGIINMTKKLNGSDKKVIVHYFIPKGDVTKFSFVFIMHGVERNGREYLTAWANLARTKGLVIVAPEFPLDQFNNDEYSEGNYVNVSNTVNPLSNTTFAYIDEIFNDVKTQFGLNNQNYYLFGHSAGAQFVHRYMLFYPSDKVLNAISANAGWYTVPDEKIDYPYGIKGINTNPKLSRANYYSKKLTIALGSSDIIRDGNLRVTKEADAQGMNRFTRGNFFFNTNKTFATQESAPFNWDLQIAENVGHDYVKMSEFAAKIWFK